MKQELTETEKKRLDNYKRVLKDVDGDPEVLTETEWRDYENLIRRSKLHEFSPMDAIESVEHAGRHGNKEIVLTTSESCDKLLEVMERFDKWADTLIADYESLPRYSSLDWRMHLLGKIQALRFAKDNLARIIKEVSCVDSKSITKGQ